MLFCNQQTFREQQAPTVKNLMTSEILHNKIPR